MSETAAPRTLADQFRIWSSADLVRLLSHRPDLAAPAPQDSAQLASRAGTRASVLRAVDQLSVLDLAVLDAAVSLGGTVSVEDLHLHVHASPESVDESVGTLTGMALLWGLPDGLRTVSVLEEIIGTTVSGLGPPAAALLGSYGPNRVGALARDLGIDPSGERQRDIALIAEHLADQEHVHELVAEVDQQARKILDISNGRRPRGRSSRPSAPRPAATRRALWTSCSPAGC